MIFNRIDYFEYNTQKDRPFEELAYAFNFYRTGPVEGSSGFEQSKDDAFGALQLWCMEHLQDNEWRAGHYTIRYQLAFAHRRHAAMFKLAHSLTLDFPSTF